MVVDEQETQRPMDGFDGVAKVLNGKNTLTTRGHVEMSWLGYDTAEFRPEYRDHGKG
jgi:hypothetical protein